MNSPRPSGPTPFTELRRRIARLFSGAEVQAIDSEALVIEANGLSLDPRSLAAAPRWAERRALLASEDCVTRLDRPQSKDPVLEIRTSLRGGPDSDVRPVSPQITNALKPPPPPKSTPLFTTPDQLPQIVHPPMARLEASRSLSLPVSRIVKRPPISLDVERISTPKVRKAKLAHAAKDVDVFAMPSEILSRVPMERRRLPMPPRGSMQEDHVYTAEKKALAAANEVEPEDVKLVGVYLGVPLVAASQMEYDETTGSLLLMLREKASATVERSKRPSVTLVLGKIKSSGRVVRAFL